jgi:hypothetical protein
MPQGASKRKPEKSLKPHLARQKGNRPRETRERDGMIKGKFGGEKARSWKPKRELEYDVGTSRKSLV